MISGGGGKHGGISHLNSIVSCLSTVLIADCAVCISSGLAKGHTVLWCGCTRESCCFSPCRPRGPAAIINLMCWAEGATRVPPLPHRQEAAVDSRPGSNEISSAYASNRWTQPLVTQTLKSPAPKAKHSMIQVQWVGMCIFMIFMALI